MPDWIFAFPESMQIDIKTPINNAVHYMNVHWAPFFSAIHTGLSALLNGVAAIVNFIPWWLLVAIVFLGTYLVTHKLSRSVLYSVLLVFIGSMGLWTLMNKTLTIVIVSVLISLIIGLPVGILTASSERSNTIARPILDTMQTMPSFVYLIPAVMLIGLGDVPAVIASTIYALPPVIRLTSHGIRQVDTEVVEAARAFGSTKFQTLYKVQIPQALPTIMTGVNQTIMMAIAMVVTSAMIGSSGLGSEVMTGINRLDSGRGFAAGIAIVIIAIIIDRLTQGIIKKDGKTS